MVKEHERRSLSCHVCAAFSHRYTYVRGFERGRVIDPVSCHGDYLSCCLKGIDNPELLLRHNPREDIYAFNAFLQFRLIYSVEFWPCDDLADRSKADLLSDVLGCTWIVPCDHDH